MAAVGYLILEAVAAASFAPGYSYARNYISDLGLPSGTLVRGQVVESSRAYLMHAAFYLQGGLFFLGALLLTGIPENRRARIFLGSVIANAVGNIVIGTVHSGKVHVAGALLAIVGGNAAIWLGSAAIGLLARLPWYPRASKLLAVLGLSCFVMLAINSLTTKTVLLPNGIWERGSVYSITLWQLLTAVCVLIPSRRAARPN
ncbi:MAG: DUF998 domain-containing protein [Mycobacterium sp.]|uniref:DUF998 domain-containing protein n=1 Tax=Mycobacterium sp. TaxID=1785 RepID=UPI001EBC8D93|nr:DUF998 domain-containing protein [Mycobacterium sp.]MBV8788315.1 DUF998 domain-containing protein [Mycobacterium sp.]